MKKNSTKRRQPKPKDQVLYSLDLADFPAELQPLIDAGRAMGHPIRMLPTSEPLTLANVRREMAEALAGTGARIERYMQGRRKKIVPAIEAQQAKSRSLRERIARALRRGSEIKQVAAEVGCHRNTVAKVKRTLK